MDGNQSGISMKITIDNEINLKNCVSSYSLGNITVNATTFYDSFILFPDQIISNWSINTVSQLAIRDLDVILQYRPEIILLGSGTRSVFPEISIIADIQAQNIGIEVMDTMAACRCYNILLSEGRRVTAALIIEK